MPARAQELFAPSMTVTLPQAKLDALVSRLGNVEADLAAGPDRDTYVKLSREFSELQPVVEAIKAYQGVESEIADLDAMLNDAATDPEMRALAETEKPALQARSSGTCGICAVAGVVAVVVPAGCATVR